MEYMPLVSVIIPVYNVEAYIGECIESVIKQTYRKLEIIIIDDGTPDNSGKIAENYALADTRIKVIHKNNGGVASARNCGIREAKGEFIVFVDSDDWIAVDHVEHLLYLQGIQNADLCMTTSFFTKRSDRQRKPVKIETLIPDQAAALLLSPKMVVGSYNKLYRKCWIIQNGLYQNEQLFSGEGLHFIVTAAQHSNCVTVSNRKIYYYRRNVSESATTKFNINMFTNNELSLDLIAKDKITDSPEFNSMLTLFGVHLKISGLLAILTFSSPDTYPDEYKRWKSEIRSIGMKLMLDKYVPLKSKIRIVCVNMIPQVWARLAKIKRNRSFRESV